MLDCDVNGDGFADLIFRRDDGLVTSWLSDGTGFQENTQFSQMVETDWQITAHGDFNADGKSDLLWRKDDGELAIWLSDGVGFDDSGFHQMVEAEWSIATVGDFNGDGFSDLFWRRDDGLVATWLNDGTGGFVDVARSHAFVDLGWSVGGAGDFDGDGTDDVAWLKDNLQTTVWTSDGEIAQVNDAWNQFLRAGRNGIIFEVGQFAGEPRDDLFVTLYERYTQTYVAESINPGFEGRNYSGGTGGMRLIDYGTGDFNGDGITDLVLSEQTFDLKIGYHTSLRVTQINADVPPSQPATGAIYYEAVLPRDWRLVF